MDRTGEGVSVRVETRGGVSVRGEAGVKQVKGYQSGVEQGKEYRSGVELKSQSSQPPIEAIRRIPKVIIIGVKKCGTRALLEYLKLHPLIKAPGPEPHFFDRNNHRGLDWYRSMMPATNDHEITIEKTPRYFVSQDVPEKIYNMSPNVKLVVVIRDPVIRAMSDFTQAVSKHEVKSNLTFRKRVLRRDGDINMHSSVVKTGIYVRYLTNWFQYFGRSNIHIVSGFGDALRCMSCHSTPTIQQCRGTTSCNEHEICSIEQFISATGAIYYRLGCQSKGTCQNLSMGRRGATNKTGEEDVGDIAICGECCSSLFCNMEGCGQPALPTSERGPYCFTCDKASFPDGCDNVTICEKGDSCMLYIDASDLGQSGNVSYTGLCETDHVCSALEHAHLNSKCPATCCKGDFCNTKCGDISTTATTVLPSIDHTTHNFASLATQKPYCPPDHTFDSLSLLCIKLEEATKVSFSEAQAFCRQTGDELVTLDTYAKFNFVQYAIIHHSKEEQKQRNYWIGAYANLTLSGKVFGWESMRTWDFTAWGTNEPDGDPSQLCVVLNVLENYEWFDTRCDSPFHFICEHDILVNGGFTAGMAHPTTSFKPLTTRSTPSTVSALTHSSLTSSSTTVLTTTSQLICDTTIGFTLLSNGSTSLCLKVYNHSATWDVARSICHAENADLVVLDTSEKGFLFRQWISGYDNLFWLGAMDHSSSGNNRHHFQWINRHPIDSQSEFWSSSQPNSDTGQYQCLIIYRSNNWHDRPCREHHLFICQRNL
ncbi:uncharacterized protein LOC128214383 [Mya arenaria]|uniref:uncharacterized protein LOC128214383 n=1 Tax=Mya arenaria TaxID=6604 RepID=UPI0022E1AECA|nr:uncharacterized protein LOC128214383 [Mya arenaria]